MIRIALRLLAFVAAIVVIVTVIGTALPREHVASRDATFDAPADRVFAILLDVEHYPAWRSDVTSVEMLSKTPLLRWRERGSNDTLTFEVVEAQPPVRMVTRIADPTLPFGGTWTHVLSSSGAATTLSITERGEVYNPIFRFMARFVFGHTATIDRFLADLRQRVARRE